MLAFDVFSDEAFQATELKELVDSIVYIPQMLNNMNLFEVETISTETVTLRRNDETLEFVPTTERGSPRSLPGKDRGKVYQLPTLNLRQEDRIKAIELQNLVNEYMPFEVALANAEDEVDKRLRKLMRKLEFTREFHRFNAIAGLVLDADRSLILDLYQAFGFTQPAPVMFNFATLTEGNLRNYVTQRIYRPMMRQLNARKGPNTRIGALCSDDFWDKMMLSPEIRKTYEIQQQGQELRDQKAWQSLNFAGVEWSNFMGTDDNSTIAIPAGRARFFPIGATEIFKEYRAPGEEMRAMNRPGEEFYQYVIPDSRAPVYMDHVDLYLDAHPLFACIGPDVLMEGQAQ